VTPREELYFLELDLTCESNKKNPDKRWVKWLKRSILTIKKELKNNG